MAEVFNEKEEDDLEEEPEDEEDDELIRQIEKFNSNKLNAVEVKQPATFAASVSSEIRLAPKTDAPSSQTALIKAHQVIDKKS